MASLFAHAALPLVAAGAFRAPPGHERRLRAVAVLCACLPDLDMAAVVFEVRATDPLGHRGFSHSLFFAAALALFATDVWFRALGRFSREWWRVCAFLFGAAASHGLLDAMTTSEVGVALLSPASYARWFFPFKLLPSCPVGLTEYLGFWGLMTLANELFYAVIPAAIVVTALRRITPPRRTAMLAAVWAVSAVALRATFPDWFAPVAARPLMPIGTPHGGDPHDLPTRGLPDEKIVTRFDELRTLGLFDRTLTPAAPAWSSSFFPSWFGGEAGRWTEGNTTLVWRTLFGVAPPTEDEAMRWLSAAAAGDAAAQKRLFTLAPTEKLDLALGRYDFPATVAALKHSHNGTPRYWSGRCNGIAGAAMNEAEPFRVVTVIGGDGARIRFHPNDIKALLAVAYYDPVVELMIGKSCDVITFDSGATCSINPGTFVVALLNRIGRGRQPMMLDAVPTIAKQYYVVASATVRVKGGPYAPGAARMDPALAGRVASLVDVAVELTLSSTTLRYGPANVLDPATPDGSRYRRVGVVPVVMRHEATLALDAASEIIGGRWTGDPPDGPDNVVIVDGGPKLLPDGMLATEDRIPWGLVRDLARASAEDGPGEATIDLRER